MLHWIAMHVKLYDVPELCLKKFDLLKSLLNIHVLQSQTCFYSQRRKSALQTMSILYVRASMQVNLPETSLLGASQWTWTLESQWMRWYRCCAESGLGMKLSSYHTQKKWNSKFWPTKSEKHGVKIITLIVCTSQTYVTFIRETNSTYFPLSRMLRRSSTDVLSSAA